MSKVVDIVAIIMVVGAITVLVRPSSQGPSVVQNLTGGFANIISAATT